MYLQPDLGAYNRPRSRWKFELVFVFLSGVHHKRRAECTGHCRRHQGNGCDLAGLGRVAMTAGALRRGAAIRRRRGLAWLRVFDLFCGEHEVGTAGE